MDEEKKTRNWLGRARGINREIEALLKTKKETRDQLLRITQNYTSDGAQSTKDPHKYDRLAELESTIDQKVNELLVVKQEITETIMQLQDGRQRCVLLSYYVRCTIKSARARETRLKEIEDVAREMNFSIPHTKRLLREARQNIEKMIPNDT